MGIENWSTTAGDNDSAPPNGAPEGMFPSAVNNTMRSNMAAVRSWYEDAEFINLGYSLTYVDGTHFRITDDVTSQFTVGRRIRAEIGSAVIIMGTITAAAYTTYTEVTVLWDSGALDSGLAKVWLGSQVTNKPISSSSVKFLDNTIPSNALLNVGIVSVGDMVMNFSSTAADGWEVMEGQTVGDATSGADLAAAGYEELFTHLWNSVSDTYAPVSSGRGASAAADFAAHKTITMPDPAGRSPLGTGTGATTAEGDLEGTERVAGEVGGYETHTLIVDELASHTHTESRVTATSGTLSLGSNANQITSVNTGATGGDDPHNNMHPFFSVYFHIFTGVFS